MLAQDRRLLVRFFQSIANSAEKVADGLKKPRPPAPQSNWKDCKNLLTKLRLKPSNVVSKSDNRLRNS
jgi:hypothetical protein